MYAEFTGEFVISNKTMDSQHRELIDKINDLQRSCETGKEKTTAILTLDYLSDYTNFHFRGEECSELAL